VVLLVQKEGSKQKKALGKEGKRMDDLKDILKAVAAGVIILIIKWVGEALADNDNDNDRNSDED